MRNAECGMRNAECGMRRSGKSQRARGRVGHSAFRICVLLFFWIIVCFLLVSGRAASPKLLLLIVQRDQRLEPPQLAALALDLATRGHVLRRPAAVLAAVLP